MKHLTLIEKAFFLKRLQLFSELDLDLLLAIADKVEELSVEKEDIIFTVNQDAHRLYCIYSGEVAIFDESKYCLAMLYPPDYFGDEALFNQTSRRYAAVATTDTSLLTIGRGHLSEVMLESPAVAIALIRAYAKNSLFRNR